MSDISDLVLRAEQLLATCPKEERPIYCLLTRLGRDNIELRNELEHQRSRFNQLTNEMNEELEIADQSQRSLWVAINAITPRYQ